MNLKNMKKTLSILVIMAIILSTVGCSIEELEYYSLYKQMDQMKAMETSGTVSVALGSDLVDEMLYDSTPETEILREVLASGFDIKYTAKLSEKPLAYEVKLEFRKKGEAGFKKVTTVIGDDKITYINMKECLTFLKPYIVAAKPDEEKIINALIAKVGYVHGDIASSDLAMGYPADLSGSDDISRIVSEFSEIFKEAYSGFSTDAITKKGNGYELRLEADDIKPIVIKLVEYTVANIDAIVEKTTAKINAMPEADIELLSEAVGDPTLDKEYLLSSIDEFSTMVKEIPPEDIEDMKNDESVDMIFDSIEGSVLSSYIEKEGDNKFKTSTELIAKYGGQMYVTLKETAQMKKLDAFSITKPAKSMTEEELDAVIKSVLPVRVDTVKLNLKTKKATILMSNEKTSNLGMPYYTLKGETYAYMPAISKALGTQMTWDAKKSKAIVKKDGQSIELAAKKINGYIFVKVTELEKLGYLVSVDEKTREISIINMNKLSIFE